MTKSPVQKPAAESASSPPGKKKGWSFWQRRQCPLPTWRGWLLIAVVVGAVGMLGMRGAYPFLAVNDPKPGGVLVVEGWAPDYALEAALSETKQYSYEKVFVTGGPIDAGAPLSSYKTYAESGTATLLALGMST